MLTPHPNHDQIPNSVKTIYAKVFQLAATIYPYSTYPVAYFDRRILSPLLLGQYVTYSDKSDNLLGFMSWACVSGQFLQNYIEHKFIDLDPNQWNSGKEVIVGDIFSIQGHTLNLMRRLKYRLHSNHVQPIYWTTITDRMDRTRDNLKCAQLPIDNQSNISTHPYQANSISSTDNIHDSAFFNRLKEKRQLSNWDALSVEEVFRMLRINFHDDS